MVLVGEQPGDAEDRQGSVRRAGRQAAAACAFRRRCGSQRRYVTNAVKHFRFTERGKRRIHATPQVSHPSLPAMA